MSPIGVGDSSLLDVIDTVIKSLLLLLLVTKSASLVFILNVKIWNNRKRVEYKPYPSMSMTEVSILYTASLMSSNWQLRLLMMIPIVCDRPLSSSLAA